MEIVGCKSVFLNHPAPKAVKASEEPLAELMRNFGLFDRNGNGFLEANELQYAALCLGDETGQIASLAVNLDALKFANIDPGAAAWHGLSVEDLTKIQAGSMHGNSIESQATEYQQQQIVKESRKTEQAIR